LREVNTLKHTRQF